MLRFIKNPETHNLDSTISQHSNPKDQNTKMLKCYNPKTHNTDRHNTVIPKM